VNHLRGSMCAHPKAFRAPPCAFGPFCLILVFCFFTLRGCVPVVCSLSVVRHTFPRGLVFATPILWAHNNRKPNPDSFFPIFLFFPCFRLPILPTGHPPPFWDSIPPPTPVKPLEGDFFQKTLLGSNCWFSVCVGWSISAPFSPPPDPLPHRESPSVLPSGSFRSFQRPHPRAPMLPHFFFIWFFHDPPPPFSKKHHRCLCFQKPPPRW